MDLLVSGGRKRQILSDLSAVVEGLRSEADYHNQALDSFDGFADALGELLRTECSGAFDQLVEPIVGSFKQATVAERGIVEAKIRRAEDLNDLSARFGVVFRVCDELGEARRKLKEAKEKLTRMKAAVEDDRRAGGVNRVKCEAQAANALTEKQAAVEVTMRALENAAVHKEKYALFKVRRLRNAFVNLGRTADARLQAEGAAWNEAIRAIGQARASIDAVIEGTYTGPPAEPAPVERVESPPVILPPSAVPVPAFGDSGRTSSPFDAEPSPQFDQGGDRYAAFLDNPFG